MILGKPETIEEQLQMMSLVDYIAVFGSITDQDANSKTFKKRVQFELWKRQKEACEFLEKNQICLLPKSRQKGYSEIAAERALKTLLQNPGVEGVCVSISEEMAKYFLDRRIMPKYETICAKFPGYFPKVVDKTREKVVFENGSSFKSIASSQTAAASMTLDFLIVDEAGGIDENRGKLSEETSQFKDILTNSMPALDQNPKAWAMIIGTSVPGSYYNKIVREAYERKNECRIKYFFIGWWHQPGRDKKWYNQQKELYKDRMPLQHPTDMEDFFYVRDGLVFPHFDHKEGGRHIYQFMPGSQFRRKIDDFNVTRYNPSWNCIYLTSYDHGTQHPAVNLYILYDKYQDMMYVIDETYFYEGHNTSAEDIADAINKKLKEFPRKPDKMIADGAIFNDIGGTSIGTLFRNAGLKFKKAKKHDEAFSRELLNGRFRDNKIFIHPRCYNLIQKLKDYIWDSKKNGEKPINRDDDPIDALRYACMECRPDTYIPRKELPVDYQYKYGSSEFHEEDEDSGSWMSY